MMFTQRSPELFFSVPSRCSLKCLPFTECRVSEMCVFLQKNSIAYAIYNDEVPKSDSNAWKRGHTKGTGKVPSYCFLFSKVVDSIYLSVCLSAYQKFLPKAKLENDLHDAWFAV